jgi:hypothetical protein
VLISDKCSCSAAVLKIRDALGARALTPSPRLNSRARITILLILILIIIIIIVVVVVVVVVCRNVDNAPRSLLFLEPLQRALGFFCLSPPFSALYQRDIAGLASRKTT